MATIGYHCSHEQFSPRELLGLVRRAEGAGFRAAMSSDHFHPWSERQGQSGFAFAWLGAALQATSLPFGVVNAPGQRYHPAVIAQAAATLAEMFPERFWIALGSGQHLSEHVTGTGWPPKARRQARLKECVNVIRALWAGKTVTHDGLVRVREAKLYTRPAQPPRIVGAAVSAETAEWVGSWADALITVFKPVDQLKEVVDAFRRGGGAGKPMLLQAQTCYAPTVGEPFTSGVSAGSTATCSPNSRRRTTSRGRLGISRRRIWTRSCASRTIRAGTPRGSRSTSRSGSMRFTCTRWDATSSSSSTCLARRSCPLWE